MLSLAFHTEAQKRGLKMGTVIAVKQFHWQTRLKDRLRRKPLQNVSSRKADWLLRVHKVSWRAAQFVMSVLYVHGHIVLA
jgi:hypothetical protein